MASKRVIIVGGVAGGASCAARLRRLDETAEIRMYERGSHVSFANCGLPYYVGGVIAGASRLPMWQFVIAGWVGKSLRLMVLAFAGHYLLGGEWRPWMNRSV